mgnify:CR=1 FL=1
MGISTEELKIFAERGGSAFPFDIKLSDGSNFYSTGLSARDWFAGQIAARLVSGDGPQLQTWEQIAAAAYDGADAMLAARKEPGR